MRKLKSQTEFKFKIILKSPLLIASLDSAAINVGGVDTLMMQNPVTEHHFIPSSSLYGKLRYLYHIIRKDTDKEPDYYFGSAQTESGASIINIKNIKIDRTNSIKETLITKTENTISRMTLEAKPRILQPAQNGLAFICTILINIYDDQTETPDGIINSVIIPSLRSLEDDYIGGCGTRGFGEVEIYIEDKDKPGQWNRVHNTNQKLHIITITQKANDSIAIDPDAKELKQEIVYMNTSFFSDSKIQSSTLAGLFAYALADMGHDSFIEHIYNGKDFLISSAFPCVETEKEVIHFFPRPLEYVSGIKTHKNKKRYFDDFQYISKTLLDAFFKGKNSLLAICNGLDKDYIIRDNLLMTAKECEQIDVIKLSESADLMHVSIDPKTGFYRELPDPDNPAIKKGVLFSTQDYFFSKHYKFFFFVRHRFKDIRLILSEFERLGIGRDKSTGQGYFKFEAKPNTIFTHSGADSGNRFFSLSLIHPDKNDIKKLQNPSGNSYRVITRKGKRENNSFSGTGDFRAEKDKIFMLKEGSIFNFDIKGSSPVVYPTTEEGYEIKDFGHAYTIRF